MKRFSKSSHGAIAELNITPLLDLAWVLLVVFILTTTAAIQGIEVQLPKTAAPIETQIESTVRAISIKKSGEVFLDEEEVDINELEGILRALKKAKGDNLPIIIRGDEGVEYRYVIRVLDVLHRVPIEDLGLATRPPAESGA